MNLRQSITELMKFRNEIGPRTVLARTVKNFYNRDEVVHRRELWMSTGRE